MKKTVTISFLIFLVLTIIIFTSALAFRQGQKTPVAAPFQATPVATPTTAPTHNPVYDLTEIAKHNSPQDCWMAINGKVYNVTSLIATHSGGADAIIAGCGTDASQSFNTKGGQGRHSGRDTATLNNNYFVGTLLQAPLK